MRPWPVVAVTRSPWASAMARVMAKPSPEPSESGWAREASAREKRSNNRGKVLASMSVPALGVSGILRKRFGLQLTEMRSPN